MNGTLSRQVRIDRGMRAQDALQLPILQQAADELNRRAFDLFVSAGDDTYGDLSRTSAARLVRGADAYLAVLTEWVAEARSLQGAEQAEVEEPV